MIRSLFNWLQQRPSIRRFRDWLHRLPFTDPVEYKQAFLFQSIVLCLLVADLLSLGLNFVVSSNLVNAITVTISSIVVFCFYTASITILRRGNFRTSVVITAAGLLVTYTMILVLEGLRNSGWLLIAFMIPLTLAGLLTGRKGIRIIFLASFGIIATVGAVQLGTTGIVGRYPRDGDLIPPMISTFFLTLVATAFLFSRFAASLRDALTHALERERELQQIRETLEVTVHERTADLAAANDQLRTAKNAAEEANQLKSRFLANMSHELRTPLNAIINFTAFLDRYGAFSERQTDLQQRVLSNADHLLGLINDILDLSKIEAGRMDLVYDACELRPLIESVMTTASGLTREKGIDLVLEAPDDLPLLVIDKVRIRQVLLNLLSNAAKFTDHGTITLSVALPDPQTVFIAVKDQGIGIAPADHDRIFEEFQQVGDGTREYHGTGLGLPISKRLVEMHGGAMGVESAPGTGSTFFFTVPINASRPATDIPTARPPVASVGPETAPAHPDIVVIDDDPDAHETFKLMLEGVGYTLRSVLDSRDALTTIKTLRPRLIITDIQMPYLDGWEVLARIKQDPAIAAIPVVICSVIDQGTIGLVLGAYHHLVKPIREETLLAVVQACVEPSASVLIVDDSPDARRVIQTILAPLGYRIHEAANGRDGLEQIATQRPDVVILDVLMPEMDGFAFLAQLRDHPTAATIPVIVVSSKDLDVHERDWLMERAQGIIAKQHLAASEFLTHIHQALRKEPQGGA